MNGIKKLLSKTKWTGKEVGQALIAGLFNDLAATKSKEAAAARKELFSQADLSRMERSLSSPEDNATYSVYQSLFHGILNQHLRRVHLQTLLEWASDRFARETVNLRNAGAYRELVRNMPMIVTAEKHAELEAQASAQRNAEKVSYADIFIHALRWWGDKDGRAPRGMMKKVQAAEGIIIKNGELVADYVETYKPARFVYPDGRDSEDVPAEERRALEDEAYLKAHKLEINGKPCTLEQRRLMDKADIMRRVTLYHAEGGRELMAADFLKATGRELDDETEARLMKIDLVTLVDPFPLDVREMEDVVTMLSMTGGEAPLYRPQPYTPEGFELPLWKAVEVDGFFTDDDTASRRRFMLLREVCPELTASVDAHLKKAMPELSDLKPEDYNKPLFTRGDYARAGVQGRAVDEAIAAKWAVEKLARETIGYNACELLPVQAGYGDSGFKDGVWSMWDDVMGELDDFFSPYNAKSKEAAVHLHAKFAIEYSNISSLAFSLYAHNALLDILADVYSLHGVEGAKVDMGRYEANAAAMAKFVELKLAGAEALDGGGRAFTAPPLTDCKPSEQAIEATRALIAGQKFTHEAARNLSYLQPFVDMLEGIQR